MRQPVPIYPQHLFNQMPIAFYDIDTGKQATPYLQIEAHYMTHVIKRYKGERYLVCVKHSEVYDRYWQKEWRQFKVKPLTLAERREFVKIITHNIEDMVEHYEINDFMIRQGMITKFSR